MMPTKEEMAALPELNLTQDEVNEFMKRLGLGSDDVGWFESFTFGPWGIVEGVFLGKTIDDIKIAPGGFVANKETRRYRYKGAK